MRHLSYWEKEEFIRQGISIIGSGIVGLITSIELKKKFPNRKIAIFERSSSPNGASTKNAGFACFGSMTEIEDDLQNMSEVEIIDLISLRWSGLQLLQEYFSDNKLIDLQFNGGYEVFDKSDEKKFDSFAERIPYFNDLIYKATKQENCFSKKKQIFGFNLYSDVFFNAFEGQLNPQKMIAHLTKIAIHLGVQIFTNMELNEVEEDDGVVLHFKNAYTVYTDQVVYCTNAFTKRFYPTVDLEPYRNQVLITSEIPDLEVKGTFHYNKGYTYFRNVGKRILIGGFRDIDMEKEQTINFGTTDKIQDKLENFLRSELNIDANIDHRWSGILAIGDKKSAIVKNVGDGKYLAVRLGGMGVAIGAKVAQNLVSILD